MLKKLRICQHSSLLSVVSESCTICMFKRIRCDWFDRCRCRFYESPVKSFRPKKVLIVFRQYLSHLTCSRVHSCCVEIRIARHVTSCCVTSRHVASCRVMSHYVTSFHVMSRHVTSCHVMSRHVTSCHVMSRHVTSCPVLPI